MNAWNSYAGQGYVIAALQFAGYSLEQIKNAANELHYPLDRDTLQKMEDQEKKSA